jgi:hypothetical protein
MSMNERPRTAHYTCADEICLAYLDSVGELVHLYYSPSQYAKRQSLFGLSTYLQPAALALH